MRIARNPGGRDFNIQVRDNVRGHQIVGGNALRLIASRQVMASTAPAAAIKCPIMLFVLETGTCSACSPNTCRQATVSTRSLTDVLVP